MPAMVRGGADNSQIMTRDELLLASDERDVWSQRCLDWWSDGYRAGWAARDEVGGGVTVVDYNAADLARMQGEWADQARAAYAGLDAKRYPPNGREQFGDPRPGDFPGRGDRA
jgi:hypothetical protein